MNWKEWVSSVIVGIVLGVSINSATSQDSKYAPAVDKIAAKVPISSEADKYRYQALATKYALDEQQISNLVLQFLNSNENAKTIRSHQVEVMNELTPLRKKLFDDNKVSPDLYDIQGDPPEFVLIKK